MRRAVAGRSAVASTAPAASATCPGCWKWFLPGTGSTGPAQQQEQPGEVPVAGIPVDHHWPQDRPVQRGLPDRLLRREPHLFGGDRKRRGDRRRRDEHGTLDARPARKLLSTFVTHVD